ncbi:MAG: hypothetical protein ABSB33_08610 [Tepidisphaeraceae bacterium]|jgi:hypothetical protein
MPIKQTHIYRGHAIVHQVFASDLSEETIERFVVSQPGKNKHICATSTLLEAKAMVDERLAPSTVRYAVDSV